MKKVIALTCVMMFVLTSCLSLRNSDESPSPITKNELYKCPENVIANEASPDDPSTTVEKVEFDDPYAGVDISFLAVGDNLIHQNIWVDASRRAQNGEEFDFKPMYEFVADRIAAADIAFINQETVMAGAKYGYTSYPTFNSPQKLGLDLVDIGFDIINVASNHTLDKGESGYRDMLDFWHSQPVTMIGGYYNKEDYENIRITEVDGIKIAWLSYTYGTNYIALPAGSEMYVPYYCDLNFISDDELLIEAIDRAEEIADVTIVSMHFGYEEYNPVPMPESVRLAKLIADHGAEVILGHHSHCLQPIEWIETDWGKTLCIYSMGNFACGQKRQITLVGGMFTFRIETDGVGGLRVVDPMLEPTVIYYDSNWMNTRIYPMDEYTNEIAATHGMYSPAIEGVGLSVETARNFVKACIAPEFLPDYLK